MDVSEKIHYSSVGKFLTSSPWLKPGDSSPRGEGSLLPWGLPLLHRVAQVILHRLHRSRESEAHTLLRHWLSASPAVASHSGSHQERGSYSWRKKERCTVVHAVTFLPTVQCCRTHRNGILFSKYYRTSILQGEHNVK